MKGKALASGQVAAQTLGVARKKPPKMQGVSEDKSAIVAARRGLRPASAVLAIARVGYSQYISTSWQVGEGGIELAVGERIEPYGSDFGCV